MTDNNISSKLQSSKTSTIRNEYYNIQLALFHHERYNTTFMKQLLYHYNDTPITTMAINKTRTSVITARNQHLTTRNLQLDYN